MQTPTLLTISLLFLSNALSVTATPPACLLAAINVQSDPSDLKALCGTLEHAVTGNITDRCSGDKYKEAVSSYQATCFEGAGVNITITSSSASATGTNTASISGSGSASASATATATGSGAKATGTASATGSSGSSASATGSTTGASAATATGAAGALVVPGFLGVVGLVGAVLF
ncbi:uncharacterized protein EAE98_004091 [Botrytis deweyae]|uniref:Extracellular membrane protein CFEM domain-containing protein n=1 Tax=Botrytis deweyae TaxID=2478750 RepID=A0ABQ7ISL3_9HELO|nr:uncharacterized protein EAE98_004091 [Botrytis deweyae]KAF7932792.1 hypothetical protein EAE98_004091 [Botrytis deweyae]